MKRVLVAICLAAILVGIAACSSNPSSSGEMKKLEGKRIPPGAGGGRGGAAPEKN